MTIQEIQNEACRIWGITLDQMMSTRRIGELITPKRAAMMVSVEVFEYPMIAVDRAFNCSYGGTRHFVKSRGRKEFPLTDRLKYKQLRATCEQRRDKMCKAIAGFAVASG